MMAQPSVSARSTEPSLASPNVTSSNTLAGSKRKRVVEKKFYAVKEGKTPGIYHTWNDCLLQVRGHKGALFKAFQSLHEAEAFIEGKSLPHATASQSSEQKFYAVQNGKVPGVYTDWASAQTQIRGVRNPRHKKFATRAEAEAFVAEGKTSVGSTPTPVLSPEEEIRRLIVRKSAPGLITNGASGSPDKDSGQSEPGWGPLPPGVEDGFDPNIKLTPEGRVVNKTEEEKYRTKNLIRERNPPAMLRIYTDGSSLRNGQAGARAGVGVFFGPQDPKNVSEALKGSKQTNQRAELTAILRALDIAPLHRDVTIYTDSKYAIECVTNWYKNWQRNGWTNSKGKSVENKDLVQDIRSRIEERDLLKKATCFVWVKGHANDAGNIAADRLAVEGATMGRGVAPQVEREEALEESEDANEPFGSENETGTSEAGVEQAFKAMAQAMSDGGDGKLN